MVSLLSLGKWEKKGDKKAMRTVPKRLKRVNEQPCSQGTLSFDVDHSCENARKHVGNPYSGSIEVSVQKKYQLRCLLDI
jgi:hypothetical protein